MSGSVARLNAALIGRYRLERQLGAGGMATVYLAEDVRHHRKVALKVLRPELAAVVGAERFLAEIETTANLQHPHILPLFDSGEADGLLFYVMPRVEGESLHERLDRERQLPVDEAVRIATNMAEALDYAHRHGVVHRDIKPANILLLDGKPVVSDFGIALAVTSGGAGRLTETGLSLGTPHYMSPEQATGDQSVGPTTDVWALGCVLYEMLVGEPPYTGSTPQAVLGKIITAEPPSAREVRKSVPPNVDAVIRKALEKVPADRFRSAEEFGRALGDARFEWSETVTYARALSGRAWKRVALAAGALSAILLVALGLMRGVPQSTPTLMRFTVDAPEGSEFAGHPYAPQLALSPGGERLAFVSTDGRLHVRGISELTAELIPEANGASSPFFSPDGRWLGSYSEGQLRKVLVAGGPTVSITDADLIAGASWGDDGVIVFARQFDGALFTVSEEGGEPTPVPTRGSTLYSHPWVLPGGGAVLATVRADDAVDVRIAIVDLRTGSADTLGLGARATYASGHIVFSRADSTLHARPFDVETRRPLGPELPIIQGVALDGALGMGQFAASSRGLAYQTGGGTVQKLMLMNRNGVVEVPLPVEADLEEPAFSPDARRIAVRVISQIWIYDRDQGTFGQLTVDGSMNMGPVWHPNGRRIAFMSHREGAQQGQIYWQATIGAGAAEPLLATDYISRPDSWSPSGDTLVFLGRPNGNASIGLLVPGEPSPQWLIDTEFEEYDGQISPDGRWLAYSAAYPNERQVYVQALDGERSRHQMSVNGGHSPRWAPDGRTLYYGQSIGGGGTVIAAALSTEGGVRVVSREELFAADNLGRGGIGNYDIGPDGEEFIFLRNATNRARAVVWTVDWLEIVRAMTGPQ